MIDCLLDWCWCDLCCGVLCCFEVVDYLFACYVVMLLDGVCCLFVWLCVWLFV